MAGKLTPRRRTAAALASLALAFAGSSALAARMPTFDQQSVYELRVYHVAPGKMDALNARFRDYTLRLFAKHGMKSVAYWNADDPADPRVIYILAYPSREAREASWAAFRADPEWQAAAKTSEANGKLVEKVDSTFMRMTDYSPHLQGAPAK